MPRRPVIRHLTAVLVAVCGLLAVACGGSTQATAKVDAVAELQKLNVKSLPKQFTPAQRAEIEANWGGRGDWFIRNGCFSCHPVSVYNITPISPVGPDLANAVADVKSRFGRPLNEFMDTPTGTMQMVLTQLLVLTPEQKAEAIKQLEIAFAEYQKTKPGR